MRGPERRLGNPKPPSETDDMEPLINKVANSPIEVFNLEELWDGRSVATFDVSPFLDRGLILREKPFREAVRNHDWSAFVGQHVAVSCSTDAIVPVWAYMLIATALEGTAASISFGSRDDLIRDRFAEALAAFDWGKYTDKIVVVKGCGSGIVPDAAYVTAVRRLQGVASKLMFGEPCSSVPLWRKSKGGSKADPKSNPNPNPKPKPIATS